MMRAAVFDDAGNIAPMECAVPELQPGWVKLAVTAVGICGTDLNMLLGQSAAAQGIQPGHEVAAIVDSTGDGVTLESGLQVAVEPLTGCGHCAYCRTGLHNLCRDNRIIGITRPGGMAEFIVVPADSLYPIDARVPASVVALTEPLAVCVRGARLAGIEPGQRVVILGAGSIGLLAITAARAAGAGEILITARYPHQQEFARHLGADDVFPGTRALLDAVGSSYADRVIETVGGSADTLADSVRVARAGGRIVMLGVFHGNQPIPAYRFLQKELTLCASSCYGRECLESDFSMASALIMKHHERLEPLVTHRFRLDQVAEAFATAADKNTDSIKVQVQP